MVSCGHLYTAALTEGGGVYTFGYGGVGNLGHGDTQSLRVTTRVSAAGFNDERIVMLAAGGFHMVALSEEGHVYSWGQGRYGQLGYLLPVLDPAVGMNKGHDTTRDHHNPRDIQRTRNSRRQPEQVRFGNNKVVSVASCWCMPLTRSDNGRVAIYLGGCSLWSSGSWWLLP